MPSILVERDDGVVTCTLNRPERRNAVTGEMWGELEELFTEVGRDDADRVLVVTGAGGAFCSGADLGTERDQDREHPLRRMHRIGAAALALHRLPKPTIAKVPGIAAGAGANLAFGCDLIVASASARFSEIFSRRGLSVDFGGTWLLPRLVGLHRAKQLAFFGDIIPAAEADAMGLVNAVVPDEELDAVVADWARRLASGPPLALAMTKTLLNQSFDLTLAQALESEGLAQSVNFATEDTAEAIAAFREKRDPTFRGR
jgi:2-(1,2-epoxy-1,2-dihydrophenyl)acetyl-CoA isomerase